MFFIVDQSFEIVFIIDLILQFFVEYYDDQTRNIVRNNYKIAMNYIHTRFFFDFITTIPMAKIFRKMKLARLFYSIKILRMKKGLYLLDTSRIKDSVRQSFNQSLQKNIEKANEQGVMQEDSNYIDFLQLNRQLYIINRFQMIKLSLTILGVSYFVGIFWYTICDLRRISNYVKESKPDEISFVTHSFEVE